MKFILSNQILSEHYTSNRCCNSSAGFDGNVLLDKNCPSNTAFTGLTKSQPDVIRVIPERKSDRCRIYAPEVVLSYALHRNLITNTRDTTNTLNFMHVEYLQTYTDTSLQRTLASPTESQNASINEF